LNFILSKLWKETHPEHTKQTLAYQSRNGYSVESTITTILCARINNKRLNNTN